MEKTLEIVDIDFNKLVFDVIEGRGFIKSGRKGEKLFIKGFTFILIDESMSESFIDGKRTKKKDILSITVGTDTDKNLFFGKGVSVNPFNLTDLIVTLDYFERMTKK